MGERSFAELGSRINEMVDCGDGFFTVSPTAAYRFHVDGVRALLLREGHEDQDPCAVFHPDGYYEAGLAYTTDARRISARYNAAERKRLWRLVMNDPALYRFTPGLRSARDGAKPEKGGKGKGDKGGGRAKGGRAGRAPRGRVARG